MVMISGEYWPTAKCTVDAAERVSPGKQLLWRMKRHSYVPQKPRHSQADDTVHSGEWCQGTGWQLIARFHCCSGLLQLPVIWPPCAPTVDSLCADKFSGCYVLQPPESKPNITPLAILAHVLGALQPYAHLIHVQRLIPRQVCCRVCLVFCCCCCSLIGLVLSSCSVQPPRQLCSLPSKPALAF